MSFRRSQQQSEVHRAIGATSPRYTDANYSCSVTLGLHCFFLIIWNVFEDNFDKSRPLTVSMMLHVWLPIFKAQIHTHCLTILFIRFSRDGGCRSGYCGMHYGYFVSACLTGPGVPPKTKNSQQPTWVYTHTASQNSLLLADCSSEVTESITHNKPDEWISVWCQSWQYALCVQKLCLLQFHF